MEAPAEEGGGEESGDAGGIVVLSDMKCRSGEKK